MIQKDSKMLQDTSKSFKLSAFFSVFSFLIAKCAAKLFSSLTTVRKDTVHLNNSVCVYGDLTRGFLQRLLRRLVMRDKSRARPNSASLTSQGNLLTMTFLRAKSQWIICTVNHSDAA